MSHASAMAARPGRVARVVTRMPPTSFFLTSAVFHYLGPSLAVLLFVHLDVLGVAWLRIASAAVVFAIWRRPWRILGDADARRRWLYVALGVVLAGMNLCFYLAIDRLPLATVGAVEFIATVALAAVGARTRRNVLALVVAVTGAVVLADVRISGEPWGLGFAFGSCVGFILYIILAHRIATSPAAASPAVGADGQADRDIDSGDRPNRAATAMSGIDQLGLSMMIAAVVVTPLSLTAAAPAFVEPTWLLWGVCVGLCSSVIPYVTDQLAMARLPRATFSLMLSILPAAATVIGLLVLSQVPTWQDLVGIGLVATGVALHHNPDAAGGVHPPKPVTGSCECPA